MSKKDSKKKFPDCKISLLKYINGNILFNKNIAMVNLYFLFMAHIYFVSHPPKKKTRKFYAEKKLLEKSSFQTRKFTSVRRTNVRVIKVD